MKLNFTVRQAKLINGIVFRINQFENGIISFNELNEFLNNNFTEIHGTYCSVKHEYIGYDYQDQQWIKFEFHPTALIPYVTFHVDNFTVRGELIWQE